VDALQALHLVQDVRTVILSPSNADAFMRISRINVRSHIIVEPDELLTIGHTVIDDSFLAMLPDCSKVTLVGCPFIDGFTISLFLEKVSSLRIFGQALYSDARAAGAFLSRVERLQGQLLETPRHALRWIGPTFLDTELVNNIKGREVVSVGPLIIDSVVTVNDLTANITRLTQVGDIKGREETVCALLSLCAARVGAYEIVTPFLPPPEDAHDDNHVVNELVSIRGLARP
jgi:hypothetical protein